MALLAPVNSWDLEGAGGYSGTVGVRPSQVNLINNTTFDMGTMFSPDIADSWPGLLLKVPISVWGYGRILDIGIIKHDAGVIGIGAVDLGSAGNYYGVRINLESHYISAIFNGVEGTHVSYTIDASGSYANIIYVQYTDVGSGNASISVSLDLGATVTHTWTDTAPTATVFKVAIGAISDTFSAYWTILDDVYATAGEIDVGGIASTAVIGDAAVVTGSTLLPNAGHSSSVAFGTSVTRNTFNTDIFDSVWGDPPAVETTWTTPPDHSVDSPMTSGNNGAFIVNFRADGLVSSSIDSGALGGITSPSSPLRGMMSTHIDMPDPVIVQGRPYLPYVPIKTSSSMSFNISTSHIRVVDPPVPAPTPPSGTTHFWSWSALDLADPPGSHGAYNLSTWGEHSGTGPSWQSSGTYRPSVADKVIYGTDNMYHTYSRVVHFDASNVEHMWIDLGAHAQPFTWVICGMINYYPYRTYGHYLLDAGTPTPAKDIRYDWKISDSGLAYRSLMLYQSRTAVMATHTGADAVANGKHVIAPHDEIARPRVFFGVFNGNSSVIGSQDRYNKYAKAGRIDNHTHRYFVLGRRQGNVSNNLASHMTLFEIRFFNKALGNAERAAQYKQLASKWLFNKYGSGT